MFKLLLLAALLGLAYAGHVQQHGHSAGGHGHGHGWGWSRPYHGWANVNVKQNPHGYQFGLNEQGSGYNKYIWQGADYQHEHQVSHGHGWQG